MTGLSDRVLCLLNQRRLETVWDTAENESVLVPNTFPRLHRSRHRTLRPQHLPPGQRKILLTGHWRPAQFPPSTLHRPHTEGIAIHLLLTAPASGLATLTPALMPAEV